MNIIVAHTTPEAQKSRVRLGIASVALALFAGMLSSALVGCIASPAEIAENEALENEHAAGDHASNEKGLDDETAGAVSAPVVAATVTSATSGEIPPGDSPTNKPQPSPWRPSNPPNPGQSNAVGTPGTVSSTSIQAPLPAPLQGGMQQPGETITTQQ